MEDFDFELDLSCFDMEDLTDDLDVSEFVSELVGQPAQSVDSKGRVIDWESHELLLKKVQVCKVARSMYERGLMTDETLQEGFSFIWDNVQRKRIRGEKNRESAQLISETMRWISELNPGLETVIETGLQSVTLRNLGRPEAAKASRKVRDWHKVTRHNLRKAHEANESQAYINALSFVETLLRGFMNSRYWAVKENERSVQERALGQRDFYHATGKPKNCYKLVCSA